MDKENENKVWLGAVATYTGGASYTVAGQRFVRGKPTKCRNRMVRNAVYGKQGFYVLDKWQEDLEETEVEPAPAPEPVPAPAPEPVPAPAPKSGPAKPVVKVVKPVVKVAKKLLKRGGGNK